MCLWRSGDNLGELDLSFHNVATKTEFRSSSLASDFTNQGILPDQGGHFNLSPLKNFGSTVLK